MKGWMVILSVLSLGGGVYYLLNLEQDKFGSYQQNAQREPAADKSEGDEGKISLKTMPEAPKPSPISKTSYRSKKNMNSTTSEIRPLDSRKIAAQSRVTASYKNPDSEVPKKTLNIQGESYTYLDDVYAVLKKDWEASDPQIIGSFLGHYLIRSETPVVESNPVLLDTRSNTYAIVTKVLKVKLEDINDRDEIFNQAYQVVEEYSHINVILYKFNDLEELQIAYESASKHSKVRRATIEILKGARSEQ
ncbi:MAG: hypothetical protein CME65_05310 [Halobacteriovoraceae bacterium]|nr:hypothetical protein [Halobacteriovoraceae bacterium]|tara:strand:- start:1648 stop:2391 length:744 start_codon:yes stop_codon:yes gene_type:complete